MKQSPGDSKPVAKNKKAFHSYYIDSRYEVGIELLGTEVKSIRQGKVNLADAYCRIYKDRELHVHQLNIAPYDNASYVNHEPLRKRRLLMHKREILKLRNKLLQKGFTLVPLTLYFKRGWLKLELGLARGKKQYDKREVLKKKEARRELQKY